jgi:uncharacterized membrane protein
LVFRDVVAKLFRRLGMVGAIVLASALIFGAVAGGVIVHRIDTNPSASSGQAKDGESGPANRTAAAKSHGPKNKQANNGHQDSSKAGDTQDKDV